MVNLGEGFTAPDTYRRPVPNASPDLSVRAEQEDVPGQLFIHELVHAWQIAHGAFDAEYLWRGTINKFFRTAPYDYGPPVVPFGTLGWRVSECGGGMVCRQAGGCASRILPASAQAVESQRSVLPLHRGQHPAGHAVAQRAPGRVGGVSRQTVREPDSDAIRVFWNLSLIEPRFRRVS